MSCKDENVKIDWDNSKNIITVKTNILKNTRKVLKKKSTSGFDNGKEIAEGFLEEKIENTVEVRQNPFGMKFALIPAGEFIMGSEEYDFEKPVHKIRINKPFYFGIYPVTQREWKTVVGTNPSYFKGERFPVESISWNDAQEFIKKLNQKEGVDKYRLPTEAEWEYAARAGTTTRYFFGDDESKLGEYAWYIGNSGGRIHEVGQKKPNPWGLYDMYGNVWQWVQDKWHGNYIDTPTNGQPWDCKDEPYKVIRGGSWYNYARLCRSALRFYFNPDARSLILGFHLLRIV